MADKDYFLAAFERAEEKEIMHGEKTETFKKLMGQMGDATKGYFSSMGGAAKGAYSTAKGLHGSNKAVRASKTLGGLTKGEAIDKITANRKQALGDFYANNKKGVRNIGLTAGGAALLTTGVGAGVAAHKKKKKAEEDKKNGR